MSDINIETVKNLKAHLEHFERLLSAIRKDIIALENTVKSTDYTQIDGVLGKFDGVNMITDSGEIISVPANYAAKTKIIYGDIVKKVEIDGKTLFKVVEKVPKIKLDSILTKKEGEWYALTDRGSYKVSDVSADFQGAQLNNQATVFIPENISDCPFATIDLVQGFSPKKINFEEKKPVAVTEEPKKAVEPKKIEAPKVISEKNLPQSEKKPYKPEHKTYEKKSPLVKPTPSSSRPERKSVPEVVKAKPAEAPRAEAPKTEASTPKMEILDDDLV